MQNKRVVVPTVVGVVVGILIIGGFWLACRGCGASGIVTLVVLGVVIIFLVVSALRGRAERIERT